jgi:TolA-binding protein
MAAQANPVAMVMSALQSRTGAGAAPPGGGPGAVSDGNQSPDPASQYAQQVSELKGADPGMLLRQVKQMKQLVATLMVQNLERLPNVAGQLSKMIPDFDKVIKEIMQASNVDAAVRNPISLGAAQPAQMNQSPGSF